MFTKAVWPSVRRLSPMPSTPLTMVEDAIISSRSAGAEDASAESRYKSSYARIR